MKMIMEKTKVEVSVICPVYNEEKYILKCIESILSQDYSREKIEFLLIDGYSTDKTCEIILEFAKKYSFIKLLDNPHRYVSNALNIGIEQASGNVIVRIDAHCEYPNNYISMLVKYLFELDADNVGGVLETLPSNQTSISKAIAIASSHLFGVGNSKYKTGTNKIIETDTVPFGCFKREVFDKIGLFDEDLIRNQDDEFNARLINNGGKIFLIPDIRIKYFVRSNVAQMAQMYFQYGLFKPLVNKKIKKPATVRQFFPALFLIGLFFGAVLSIFSRYIFTFYIAIILLYLFIGIVIGVYNALKNKDWQLTFLMIYIFFIIHLSYGRGYLMGIYKVITNSQFKAETNR